MSLVAHYLLVTRFLAIIFDKIWFHGFQKDNQSVEKAIKIQIPSTLRKQLVDDWEFVTQQDKVQSTVCSPCLFYLLFGAYCLFL